MTITAASEGIYKEKGSKFMAFAYPVNDEETIKEKVDALRKKYFDARHHCFAWRLGADGEHYRVNDDGEPSNSAGKPILGQIISFELTNVLVVVVRYFGGVLLGVGGLMQAYKQATLDALSHADIVPGTVTESFLFTFDYPDMNRILKVLKDMDLECSQQHFNLSCSMRVTVRKNLSATMLQKLERIESLKITDYRL
ncbi:MAG: YigZ family protein [Bacteroidales bacterium]|nr:YigZ family protein [Bacteroidales bacterium]